MAISREEVRKVSLLARLLLSEQELDRMTVQLGAVLQYMDLLSEVDTGQVQPMAHPLDVTDVLRTTRHGQAWTAPWRWPTPRTTTKSVTSFRPSSAKSERQAISNHVPYRPDCHGTSLPDQFG